MSVTFTLPFCIQVISAKYASSQVSAIKRLPALVIWTPSVVRFVFFVVCKRQYECERVPHHACQLVHGRSPHRESAFYFLLNRFFLDDCRLHEKQHSTNLSCSKQELVIDFPEFIRINLLYLRLIQLSPYIIDPDGNRY